MRDETVAAVRAVLKADPSIASSAIPGLIGRLRESEFITAPPSPTYLSIAAAARHATISRWTVARWIREGRLKAARVGAVVRIRRDDLEALLSGGGIGE